jgi:hypothetical protein
LLLLFILAIQLESWTKGEGHLPRTFPPHGPGPALTLAADAEDQKPMARTGEGFECYFSFSVRQIADELIRRGIQTKAKNLIATVYATLDNAKEFNRKAAKWELREGSSRDDGNNRKCNQLPSHGFVHDSAT